jgi:hypothetical protein
MVGARFPRPKAGRGDPAPTYNKTNLLKASGVLKAQILKHRLESLCHQGYD